MRHVGLLEPCELLVAQGELLGRECVLEVLQPGRAGDRRGHARLVQEPGQRDLGSGDAPSGRDLGRAVNHGKVEVGPVERVEEGIGAGAGGPLLAAGGDGARQQPAGQRAPGHDANPWSRHWGIISRSSSR